MTSLARSLTREGKKLECLSATPDSPAEPMTYFFCAPHKRLPPCDTGVAFIKSRNRRYESTVARQTKEDKRVIARRLAEALRKHCHQAACKTDVLPGSKVRGELCHVGCKQRGCAVNGQTVAVEGACLMNEQMMGENTVRSVFC